MDPTKRAHCCHVGCEEAAVYEIVGCGPEANPEDYIHACPKHVGLLLGHRPEDGVPAYWRVTELED